MSPRNKLSGGMAMPTATLDRPSFPKTISACHAEIIKLRSVREGEDDISDRIGTLESDAVELKDQISELETENEKLKAAALDLEQENERLVERNLELEAGEEAINNFLYEVERPVGRGFKFDVIHGAAADRAILSMFDAVGRQP